MKRATVLRILTGLLVMALILGGCVAPGGAPAPADGGGEAAADSGTTATEGGDAECTDAIGCVDVAAGDPIVMASALVITGPND
ncbi:MAG: hypothetical protein KDE53_14980 [Caldilineaceae bacterium]|nr:hypothetical protein [Caldilineaceae bacterium]